MFTRERLEKRKAALRNERQSFISHWSELSQFVQPRRSRFLASDRNKGDKRHQSIINSRATQAHRTMRSGLFTGIMSPTRPWYKLETPDLDMMEFAPVKEWLEHVEQVMNRIFSDSNLYNQAPAMLGDLGLFATGCMTHADDFEDVARFRTHAIGSYAIATDDKGRVTTLMREFEQPVETMIREFGLENCSRRVKEAYDRGNYDAWMPVVHFIYPNAAANKDSKRNTDKPFTSVHYEPGDAMEEKFLRQAGFDEFPGYVPRWETLDGDTYGVDCPGMTALGDVKGLQIAEKRKAQAIDKNVNPPLHGPASLKNATISALPGGVTLYEGAGGTSGQLKPIYEVAPRVTELRADMKDTEGRINEAFYVDLFMAISQMEGIQPKNQMELSERQAEKLLQLGPALQQHHGEFLSPLIDRTFAQGLRAKIFRPPPKEIQGQVLKVNYISAIAQAQRSVATAGIDRLFGFVGGLVSAGWHGAADKVDPDQGIDEYARMIGSPSKVVRSDDQVAKIRQERAQKEQQAQMLAMAEQAAGATQKLASAKTDTPSALTNMVQGAMAGAR